MHHKIALLRRQNDILLSISKERTRISLQQLWNSCLKYCRTNDRLTAVVQHAVFTVAWKINRIPDSRLQPAETHGAFRLRCLVFAKCSNLTGAVHTSLRRELTHIKPLKTAKAILLPGSRGLSMLCYHCIGERWRLSAPLGKSRAGKATIFIVHHLYHHIYIYIGGALMQL